MWALAWGFPVDYSTMFVSGWFSPSPWPSPVEGEGIGLWEIATVFRVV